MSPRLEVSWKFRYRLFNSKLGESLPLLGSFLPVTIPAESVSQPEPSTLLEMAKAPLPKDLDGKSMVKTWRGEAGPLRSKLLVEYYSDTEFPRLQKLGYQAIRTERYKFIRYRDLTGVDELYDLHKDPFELDNLLRGDASAASLRRELSQQLDEMIDSRAPKIDPH